MYNSLVMQGPVGRWVTAALALSFVVAGCSEEDAGNARRTIRKEHMPKLKRTIREDMKRHRKVIWEAAAKLGGGFVVDDREVRERQMRSGLKKLDDPSAPPKIRVADLVTSPMTFLAAIDEDGTVIARDADPDHMKGENFAKKYPVVQRALEEGKGGYQLAEFEALNEGDQSSFSMLFVAPVDHDGKRVGAVATGIPLWRMAQRLSKQLRLEHSDELGRGLVVWVYVYKGDRLFHHRGTPPELDEKVPDGAARKEGLADSPGGFTGKMRVLGRMYGYGVMPVPRIGDDTGLIVVRADPTE